MHEPFVMEYRNRCGTAKSTGQWPIDYQIYWTRPPMVIDSVSSMYDLRVVNQVRGISSDNIRNKVATELMSKATIEDSKVNREGKDEEDIINDDSTGEGGHMEDGMEDYSVESTNQLSEGQREEKDEEEISNDDSTGDGGHMDADIDIDQQVETTVSIQVDETPTNISNNTDTEARNTLSIGRKANNERIAKALGEWGKEKYKKELLERKRSLEELEEHQTEETTERVTATISDDDSSGNSHNGRKETTNVTGRKVVGRLAKQLENVNLATKVVGNLGLDNTIVNLTHKNSKVRTVSIDELPLVTPLVTEATVGKSIVKATSKAKNRFIVDDDVPPPLLSDSDTDSETIRQKCNQTLQRLAKGSTGINSNSNDPEEQLAAMQENMRIK
jgi:hypothetical protein